MPTACPTGPWDPAAIGAWRASTASCARSPSASRWGELRGLACLVLACLALAGCGLGPGKERAGGAELRVTRDFGHRELGLVRVRRVRQDQTVMRLLRSRFDVDTRYGGRFVQAIHGLSGKGQNGRRDWFFFVNGAEAALGAAAYVLSPGDVVQWDYRRWDAAMSVPA